MSVVSLLGVKVLNNPAPFNAPYEFEITFECLEQLREDLEWKLTYVGSATSSEHDQELDSLLVGPIPIGVNKFIFEADPPSLSRLPSSEILGVTVILLTCSYASREFVRVGYYVNNEYDSEELNAEPPAKPIIDRVKRNVLAEKPRVTRFAIKWDSEESAPAEYPPAQPEVDTLDDDGAAYGAEEAELQAALERELADTEAKLAKEQAEAAEAGAGAMATTTAIQITSTKAASTAAAADGDAEMVGIDQPQAQAVTNPATEDDDEDGEGSEDGSEDLEAESSGTEDDDDDEGEAEAEADGEAEGAPTAASSSNQQMRNGATNNDDDMEMGDGEADNAQPPQHQQQQQPSPEVMMVH